MFPTLIIFFLPFSFFLLIFISVFISFLLIPTFLLGFRFDLLPLLIFASIFILFHFLMMFVFIRGQCSKFGRIKFGFYFLVPISISFLIFLLFLLLVFISIFIIWSISTGLVPVSIFMLRLGL